MPDVCKEREGNRMTLDEAIKELLKPIKSALDIIGAAFRKIREQVEEEPSN